VIRLLPIILLAGCVACRPDIPDDATVACLDGELWIYSKEARADPDPSEVKRIWGRWHPYLAALFESLATP
jgi:hypothetical protein